MAKKLRISDRVLLGTAILVDLLGEVVEPCSVAYAKLRGWLPSDYKWANFYATVYRMLTTGYMEKIIKNGQPYLRLTGRGKKRLVRDFPLFRFQDKTWDGSWCVAVFDIEEKNHVVRDRLREKLRELGFGMLQKSVYISPYNIAEDIREFIIHQGLADQVFLLVARRLFAGNEKALAERVWPLAKLNQEYKKLLEKWESRGELAESEEKKLAWRLSSRYLEILAEDPCLPKKLLPEDWQGERVRLLMKKISAKR